MPWKIDQVNSTGRAGEWRWGVTKAFTEGTVEQKLKRVEGISYMNIWRKRDKVMQRFKGRNMPASQWDLRRGHQTKVCKTGRLLQRFGFFSLQWGKKMDCNEMDAMDCNEMDVIKKFWAEEWHDITRCFINLKIKYTFRKRSKYTCIAQ